MQSLLKVVMKANEKNFEWIIKSFEKTNKSTKKNKL